MVTLTQSIATAVSHGVGLVREARAWSYRAANRGLIGL